MFFFFNDPATTEFYALSLHEALAICLAGARLVLGRGGGIDGARRVTVARRADSLIRRAADRKSTRLNSSHSQISYAVFCLKKKNSRVRTGHSWPGCSSQPGRGRSAAC